MSISYQLDKHIGVIMKHLKDTLYDENGEQRYYIGANVHIRGVDLGLPMYKKIKISVDKILPRMQLNHTSHRTTLTINVPRLDNESDVDYVMRRLTRGTYTTLHYSIEYLIEIIINEVREIRSKRYKCKQSSILEFEDINMNNIDRIEIRNNDEENRIVWNMVERSYVFWIKNIYNQPLDALQDDLISKLEKLLDDYIIPLQL